MPAYSRTKGNRDGCFLWDEKKKLETEGRPKEWSCFLSLARLATPMASTTTPRVLRGSLTFALLLEELFPSFLFTLRTTSRCPGSFLLLCTYVSMIFFFHQHLRRDKTRSPPTLTFRGFCIFTFLNSRFGNCLSLFKDTQGLLFFWLHHHRSLLQIGWSGLRLL